MRELAERIKKEEEKEKEKEEKIEKDKNKERKIIQEMIEMVNSNSDHKLFKSKMIAIKYFTESKEYIEIESYVADCKMKHNKYAAQKRAEKEKQMRELCVDENEWGSFKKNKIGCMEVHISNTISRALATVAMEANLGTFWGLFGCS